MYGTWPVPILMPWNDSIRSWQPRAAMVAPYQVINLGTGRGVTVREMVTAFEKVYGRQD